MPSPLTCSSNIENFIDGICSLMTKYFNRFDGTRTTATERERCTGFRNGIEGDRKTFSLHRESTRKNSRTHRLINQYKQTQMSFICVYLRSSAVKKSYFSLLRNTDLPFAFRELAASAKVCTSGCCECMKTRAVLRPGIPEIEPPG